MSEKRPASDYPFYKGAELPMAIAHRGGFLAETDKVDRQNTMAAFDRANNMGFKYGETDVVTTADGKVIAIHGSRNKSGERATGQPMRDWLQTLNYDEIKERVRIGEEQVPLLEELLLTFPEMNFFIDPKTDESVRPLAELINRLHAQDRVSIGAFSYKRTKAAAELMGGQKDVCTCLASLGLVSLLGSDMFGIDRKIGKTGHSVLKRTGATSLQLPHKLTGKNLVTAAHEHGIHVIVWTPNLEPEIRYNLKKGVDGIMSDELWLLQRSIANLKDAPDIVVQEEIRQRGKTNS